MTGVEAQLLREVIDTMVDNIEMARDLGQSHSVGVLLYDNLQPTQQMTMLYRVANALLRDDVPEPDLTAVNEATVYAIFRELYFAIEIEIDTEAMDDEFGDERPCDSPFSLRSLTLAAWQSSMSEEEIEEFEQDGSMPNVTSSDMSQWDMVIEGLADRILWDRDFEMEYLMADEEPARSALLKRHMGIDEDYYTAVASDVGDSQYEKIRDEIRNLVRF